MPRFAANLAFLFAERSPLERFGAAAAAGFSAVEWQAVDDLDASAMRAEIDRHGLTMLGINTGSAPSDGAAGIAAVPGREGEFDSLFTRALETIVAIGGCQIHVLAGEVVGGDRRAAERVFVANLMRAADRARDKNITILIEPLNLRDRPDYFLLYAEQAADIIAKVGKPNVKIQFDFYHAQIMRGDLIARFKAHLPLIGHIQIAAVPSRAEPDEGEIHYPAILEAIDRFGWSGFVGCEYMPRGRTEDGLSWAQHYGLKPRNA